MIVVHRPSVPDGTSSALLQTADIGRRSARTPCILRPERAFGAGWSYQNGGMPDAGVTLTIRSYDATRGAVADIEGGNVTVTFDEHEVVIAGDSAGLRDLARWCLAISDEHAPRGVHVHLDPNVTPLTIASLPIVITRQD
jgi:hypothetical protein